MPELPTFLSGAKVLIVEDSPELAALYSTILTVHGAQTIVACTMRDGLNKSFQVEPDLILCDISMAHGSGFDFIRAVRAMEKDTGRHVAAAAVTGQVDDQSRRAARTLGFDECLAKPVTHEVLVETARRLLNPLYDEPMALRDSLGDYVPPGRRWSGLASGRDHASSMSLP